jgi:hypothetical protein
MSKTQQAQQAYEKIIEEVFKFDNNPTYELCGITIENMVGRQALEAMTQEGFIKYVGRNHNGLSIYQIRE